MRNWRRSVLPMAGTVWSDVRYALRMARKAPLFTSCAALILGLGIGGNTALFSIVRAVLLAPLGYRDPGRLVSITLDNPQRGVQDGPFSLGRLEEMRAKARSFEGIGAFLRVPETVTLSGAGDPEALRVARVSGNFLDILGVRPVQGRGFLPVEDAPGGAPVAMISARLWKRRFGGDPAIGGRAATVDATPHTIVGVLPEDFAFPFADLDVWVTRPAEPTAIPSRFWPSITVLQGFARLGSHVSLEQARAESDLLNRQYLAAHPGRLDGRPGVSVRLTPLQDRVVANVRSVLWLLLGAAAFVLLVVCANLASLLLARAASRSRELAVRAALGAGRGRLIQQLLAESLILASVGGAMGIVLAVWGVRALARLTAFELPRAGEIEVDGPVLLFSVALSAATGVLFGLAPALHVSRPEISDVLRAGGPLGRDVRGRRWVLRIRPQSALVVGQVALSMVLLIGAALLLRSLARLRTTDPGFQPANVLTMKIALPPTRYDTSQRKAAFFDALAARAAGVPGVRSAAVARSLPTIPALFSNVQVEGQPQLPPSEQPTAQLQSVTPGYFDAMGIPLRKGRGFSEQDNARDAPPVIVVNESFARKFWPGYPTGSDPLGRRMGEGADRLESAEIIGVVGDVREAGLAAEVAPVFYVLPVVHAPQGAYLAVRVDSAPLSFANSLRHAVLAIDPDQSVSEIKTMEQVLDSTLGQRRLTVQLLGAFACAALALAATGIYGTMAYQVAHRTHEVGIRRALGATRGDIVDLVLKEALRLTLGGLLCGFAGAWACTRVLRTLLFHVGTTDVTAFGGVAMLLVIVSLVASIVPAWRAARIDPMTALRD
jgi:putative ABC transport system permease protein